MIPKICCEIKTKKAPNRNQELICGHKEHHAPHASGKLKLAHAS